METISREKARELMDEGKGTAVIEVLSPEKFEQFHLPGAKNVPLDDQFEAHIQEEVPDKSQQVVVYCQSAECDASPKAAQKMGELGYTHVYDYEAGKTDWKDAGYPVES
ncbi:MAG: rhodanese-like domain-containing protein [Planctomycetaceae bacterium]